MVRTDSNLQELILSRMDLSKQLSEEQIKDMIDEQIRLESKKHSMEVTAREALRKEIYR